MPCATASQKQCFPAEGHCLFQAVAHFGRQKKVTGTICRNGPEGAFAQMAPVTFFG